HDADSAHSRAAMTARRRDSMHRSDARSADIASWRQAARRSRARWCCRAAPSPRTRDAMRRSLAPVITVVALCPACAARGQDPVRADAPMVSIDCSRPLHEVPATLFGIFFEEINHAGDGGLYAELLRNRAFEEPGDGDAIPGWSLAKGAHATMRRDASAPCQPQAPTALRIDVAAGTAVVQNGGFFGVPVHSQQRYRLRLDARWQGTAPPALRAELRRGDGSAIATAPLGSCTAAWQR